MSDNILIFYAAQQALKVATTLKRGTQLDLHLLADMTGKLLKSEQRPIHARRRHL